MSRQQKKIVYIYVCAGLEETKSGLGGIVSGQYNVGFATGRLILLSSTNHKCVSGNGNVAIDVTTEITLHPNDLRIYFFL